MAIKTLKPGAIQKTIQVCKKSVKISVGDSPGFYKIRGYKNDGFIFKKFIPKSLKSMKFQVITF